MKFQTRCYRNSHQNKMVMLATLELPAINIKAKFFKNDTMNPLSKCEIFLLHVKISDKFDVVDSIHVLKYNEFLVQKYIDFTCYISIPSLIR